MTRRIFVDMDGVLAKFHPEASLEDLHRPGYFEALEPQRNVVDAIREIIETDEYEVYVLSAVLSDKAAEEKMSWLERYLPTLPQEKQIFVPYGESKTEAVLKVTGRVSDSDVLLDDFTPNLIEWPGTAVKLLNGINHTRRTWRGLVVNGSSESRLVRIAIDGILVSL